MSGYVAAAPRWPAAAPGVPSAWDWPAAAPGWPAAVGALALCLAALAVIGGGRREPRRRVTGLVVRAGQPAERGHGRRRSVPIGLVALLAGVAAAVVLGGWPGAVVGSALGVALDRGLRRLEPRSARREKAAVRAGLPFAADLLAAVLRSGAPPTRAIAQVADAVGGPLGDRLRRVARSLALGAPPAEAWSAFEAVPEAAPLVRAAVRASESGAALAGVCARLAAELRAGEDAAAEAAARRAGVLVVLPLGCCFLPAFALLGVVPVVLGVLDGVLL
jgi:pilus assembly protein TadC